MGALVIAAIVGVFGVLGLAGGVAFFSSRGQQMMGLSTNGLLSTISLITAAILIGAAIRGGRLASTVMIAGGVLFLVSALMNLAVLDSNLNFLAFRLSNVFFSIGVGLVLLLLGTYGRVSGALPHDNPYYLARHSDDASVTEQPIPAPTPEQASADLSMAEAERSVAGAKLGPPPTADQSRRVAAMSDVLTHEDRRRVWMSYDERGLDARRG